MSILTSMISPLTVSSTKTLSFSTTSPFSLTITVSVMILSPVSGSIRSFSSTITSFSSASSQSQLSSFPSTISSIGLTGRRSPINTPSPLVKNSLSFHSSEHGRGSVFKAVSNPFGPAVITFDSSLFSQTR